MRFTFCNVMAGSLDFVFREAFETYVLSSCIILGSREGDGDSGRIKV